MAAFLCAGPAAADTVRMAFGDSLPPYILVQDDAGIEIEIVRAALALRGHVLEASYMPMGRIPVEFMAHRVDAIMMDVGEDMSKHGGYYASPPVLYENVFYTLKRRALSITAPADLKDLRIISFVGAARRYPAWLAKLEHSSLYVERNNQSAQPKLLGMGRYDAVLCDRKIFQYYLNQLVRERPEMAGLTVDEHSFTVTNPLDYRPVFRSEAVRDDFNAGLAELRKTGRYRSIYQKYLGR